MRKLLASPLTAPNLKPSLKRMHGGGLGAFGFCAPGKEPCSLKLPVDVDTNCCQIRAGHRSLHVVILIGERTMYQRHDGAVVGICHDPQHGGGRQVEGGVLLRVPLHEQHPIVGGHQHAEPAPEGVSQMSERDGRA